MREKEREKRLFLEKNRLGFWGVYDKKRKEIGDIILVSGSISIYDWDFKIQYGSDWVKN